jgi:hypothetical protein
VHEDSNKIYGSQSLFNNVGLTFLITDNEALYFEKRNGFDRRRDSISNTLSADIEFKLDLNLSRDCFCSLRESIFLSMSCWSSYVWSSCCSMNSLCHNADLTCFFNLFDICSSLKLPTTLSCLRTAAGSSIYSGLNKN